MDREVYLMLVGAGISLGSGVITLLLQFLFGLWKERVKEKQEEKEQRVTEIRTALMDKSLPTRLPGSLLKRIEVAPGDLDLPSFLRRKDGKSHFGPITPWQLIIAVDVVVLVFVVWYVLFIR
ncbi:MAG: hypothetical protein ACOYYU_11040 [Chloroflexota bacterium]